MTCSWIVASDFQRFRVKRYNEDQPRDADGRFGSGGDSKTEPLSGGKHIDAPQWSAGGIRNMTKDAIASTGGHDLGAGPGLYWGAAGDAKAAVAAGIAATMGPALDEKIASAPLAGPMEEGYVYAGGFAKDANGNDPNKAADEAFNIPGLAPERTTLTIGEALNEYNVVHLAGDGSASIGGIDNPILGARNQQDIANMTNGVLRDENGKVTAALGNTPEARQMVRESMASALIQTWAGSSNDSSPRSLAMQEAAVKEFGLKNTAGWVSKGNINDPTSMGSKALDPKVAAELKANGALYQSFLRAQYTNTQAALAKEGITSMSLYRGQGVTSDAEKAFMRDPENGGGMANPITDTMRPLSAFSADFDVAERFASNAQGTIQHPENGTLIYSAEVPASRILSTPATGFGCLNEYEVVVLGGTENIEAFQWKQPTELPMNATDSGLVSVPPEPLEMGQAALGKDKYGNPILP